MQKIVTLTSRLPSTAKVQRENAEAAEPGPTQAQAGARSRPRPINTDSPDTSALPAPRYLCGGVDTRTGIAVESCLWEELTSEDKHSLAEEFKLEKKYKNVSEKCLILSKPDLSSSVQKWEVKLVASGPQQLKTALSVLRVAGKLRSWCGSA